ncbi:MAG TPA: PfkB family carbohydrate kinase [Terracidiphilus sp.]|nr:PfkB family carbohydrate kinase [Terracidiphilus sp.]
MADVIFIGLSTIDVTYRFDRFPKANEKIAALGQDVFVGGSATNASIAFVHLGGRASLVTAVGRHPLASMVREELGRYGIQAIDLNAQSNDVPPISSIAIDKKRQRSVISANAVRLHGPEAAVDRSALASARMLMVDGHYMQACQAWVAAARALDKPVVFDGAVWKEGRNRSPVKECAHGHLLSRLPAAGMRELRAGGGIPEGPRRNQHRHYA